MRAPRWIFLFSGPIILCGGTPVYTAAGIVNAGDSQAGVLAPNTIGTIYGTGLAYGTRSIGPDDIRGGVLPTVLPGTGVRVIVGGIGANIYYVSPSQINFLVPPQLLPGTYRLQIILDGTQGPEIPIQLAAASPALFQVDAQNIVAVRPDGSPITAASPAAPGDVVVLYATGLGETVPRIVYAQVPTEAAPLLRLADFKTVLDGTALDASGILYAGIAPGFAGLYQINLKLPAATGPNPEIRIGTGDSMSKPGLRLPVRP